MRTMIRATTGAPVRFVASVVVLWTGARVAAVWVPDLMPPAAEGGEIPPIRTALRDGEPPTGDYVGSQHTSEADRRVVSRASGIPAPTIISALEQTPRSWASLSPLLRPANPAPAFGSVAPSIPQEGTRFPLPASAPPILTASLSVPVLQPAMARNRPLSFDGFVFLRRGGLADPVEPTLGGSQALVSARYSLTPRVAVTGRLVSALEGSGRPRQSEAAVGVGVRPVSGLPVELVAERRVALSDDGRDAWQLRAVGGASIERSGWRLEGYGQAGVVGARSQDLFADAQLRVSRTIVGPVRLGAIAAGAAQPGAARLDVGPQVRVDLRAGSMPLALLADYRVRVAGSAAPGSGPALTLATSF